VVYGDSVVMSVVLGVANGSRLELEGQLCVRQAPLRGQAWAAPGDWECTHTQRRDYSEGFSLDVRLSSQGASATRVEVAFTPTPALALAPGVGRDTLLLQTPLHVGFQRVERRAKVREVSCLELRVIDCLFHPVTLCTCGCVGVSPSAGGLVRVGHRGAGPTLPAVPAAAAGAFALRGRHRLA
jgi:hypothetical protein